MQEPMSALDRITAVSRPVSILIAIALALLVWVALSASVMVLFFFHERGPWFPVLLFSANGLNIAAASVAGPSPGYAIALDILTQSQRGVMAALICIGAAVRAPILWHLYRLFRLYAQGVVFERENAARLKGIAAWLIVSAVVIHICGRVFSWSAGAPSRAGVSALLAGVGFGAITYVIARVMELAREADLERKDFV